MYLADWITASLIISCSAHPLHEVADHQEQWIRGGQDATIGAYPWQISFGSLIDGQYHHHCGGSIIDKQWILTAAHCVRKGGEFIAVAGIYDLRDATKQAQLFPVEKVIQHDLYSFAFGNNDVALLKINGSFLFNELVSPIRLAHPDQEKFVEGNNSTYCVTSGWGAFSFHGFRPMILQAVEMPLIPLQICKDSYASLMGFYYEVTDDMLCTGHMKGDKSPCNGDSGGPLACIVEGKWTLAGVVSWGKDCGFPGYPGLYARVTYFYDWIQKKMEK